MARSYGPWTLDWRRLDCLAGCGEPVKRAVQAWVEIGGTQCGRWLLGTRVDAGRLFSDPLPAPGDEQLYMLGAAHRDCLQKAYSLLRHGQAVLVHPLQPMFIDAPEADQLRSNGLPASPGKCPFCQDLQPEPTKEDIYPIWLVKELRRLGVRPTDPRQRNIHWPTTPVCRECNNNWMSALENDVSKILLPMFYHVKSVSPNEQNRLALWAAVKAILIDSSGAATIPHGFGQSLEIFRRPHQGMRIWMATYEDDNPLALIIRRIYAGDGEDKESDGLIGWCVTFSVLRVSFQVFIPFIGGDLAVLPDFLGAVVQIWPPTGELLNWPPPYRFDSESIKGLAARINDNREVVEMDIHLAETFRSPGSSTPNPP